MDVLVERRFRTWGEGSQRVGELSRSSGERTHIFGPYNRSDGLTVQHLERRLASERHVVDEVHTVRWVQTLIPDNAQIERQLSSYLADGKRLVVSSSFQTQSLPLLHLLSKLNYKIPVAFLDTSFHFPETLTFRDEVVQLLGLDLITVTGLATQRECGGNNGLYAVSETACCNLNKVEPMKQLLDGFDVWISGVRKDQTVVRQGFNAVMPGPSNSERYHPILSWTDADIAAYRTEHDLPAHPLDSLGYSSIGCVPCTEPDESHYRSGRWSSTEKTECGLHL